MTSHLSIEKNSWRTIVWGLETPHTSSAIKRLQTRGLLEVLAWFGEKHHGQHVTHHVYDFQGKSKAVQQSTYKTVKNSVSELICRKALFEFLEVTSRSYQNDIKSFHDLTEIVHCQINYLEYLLVAKKIDLVIFHNVPHEGPDYLLYQIALARGVRTIIFNQSLFENRLFMFEKIQDLGLLVSVCQDKQYVPPLVERKFEKNYFYMAKVKPLQRFSSSVRRFLSSIKVVLSFLALFGFKKSRRYYYKHFYSLDFLKSKSKYTNNKIDLNHKYVYFPLHLQPEMTTSSLGGDYCDQLLAIERVRDLIPPDWLILIKENPKQTYTHRGQDFFNRLNRIPNIQYLTEGNTHQLTEYSQFVATITGSAGWEAICGGKNVLIFGAAWYRSLPGVYEYRANLRCEEIMSNSASIDEVRAGFERLMATSMPGIVDPAYIQIFPGYSVERNNQFIEGNIIRWLASGV
jgi:hypothetical protein